MYQILANEIINRKKVRLSVVLNGENKGKQILFNERNEICLADDGMPDKLASEIWKQNGTGTIRMLDKVNLNQLDMQTLETLMSPGVSENGPVTEVFTEVFTAEPELVILGGGHVAIPVCHMAAMTGFHVTIVEDRPDMITKERFPGAANIICQPFEDLSSILEKQGENSFYVIVTRGHKYDQICLEQVLRHEYTYLGVIGSRRKVAQCRELLREHGFRNAEIASIHMPIGLNIGAQSPEEIAVSILAEMIQEKNRRQADCSPLAIWEWIASHPGERVVMATIIEKNGSAPRGVGSRMLCLKDGTIIGTIGGGALEYAVIKAAAKMKEGEMKTRWFNLSNEAGAQLGMVCGGSVRVLMQEIML